MAKAASQKVLTHKSRDRTAAKLALAALACVWIQSGCVAGWEYISTGWWWATLMRHCLLARPPLPLAPGVGVTALAAVLVAFGSGALGATSGLVRAGRAAVALAAVAAAGMSAAANPEIRIRRLIHFRKWTTFFIQLFPITVTIFSIVLIRRLPRYPKFRITIAQSGLILLCVIMHPGGADYDDQRSRQRAAQD